MNRRPPSFIHLINKPDMGERSEPWEGLQGVGRGPPARGASRVQGQGRAVPSGHPHGQGTWPSAP